MCWIGKKSDKCIAQEDITCYKVVFDDLLSTVQLFKYGVGKTYSTKLGIEENINNRERISISKGFHCYMGNLNIIKSRYRHSKGLTILTCKIPKGTIYYENEHNVGVTTRLIVEKATLFGQFFKQYENNNS